MGKYNPVPVVLPASNPGIRPLSPKSPSMIIRWFGSIVISRLEYPWTCRQGLWFWIHGVGEGQRQLNDAPFKKRTPP